MQPIDQAPLGTPVLVYHPKLDPTHVAAFGEKRGDVVRWYYADPMLDAFNPDGLPVTPVSFVALSDTLSDKPVVETKIKTEVRDRFTPAQVWKMVDVGLDCPQEWTDIATRPWKYAKVPEISAMISYDDPSAQIMTKVETLTADCPIFHKHGMRDDFIIMPNGHVARLDGHGVQF